MEPATIMAMIAAADIALEAIPTAAEKDAAEKVKEYKALEEEGRLGDLTADEEALFADELAVARKAGEDMGANVAAALSSTDDRSGGQALEVAKGAVAAEGLAAASVDAKRAEAKVDKTAKQEAEYEAAIAVKSGQQEDLVDTITDEAAAQALGAYLGGTGGMAGGDFDISNIPEEYQDLFENMDADEIAATTETLEALALRKMFS